MSIDDFHLPTMLPLLSRGRHGSARDGACFMELASMMAGERWSDRPSCTHPLLAAVARHVNDHTSDEGRQRLARLIPSVIGLTSDDLRVDARIALRCATTALSVASAERRLVMAVAVRASERMLAALDGKPVQVLEVPAAKVLAGIPDAARWGVLFSGERCLSPKTFRSQTAPTIVSCAIAGIAQARLSDPDETLRGLLIGAIDDCSAWARAQVLSAG